MLKIYLLGKTLSNKPAIYYFSQWFVKARKKAGLPEKCVPHGLRKVATKNLVEARVPEYQLMAVMGWTNPAQAKVYLEKVNRGKMASAAMHKLSKKENNDENR